MMHDIENKFFVAVSNCLLEIGFNKNEIDSTIKSWTYAEDSEKFSHGFIRLPWLARLVQTGSIIPDSNYKLESKGFSEKIFGNKSLGYRAADVAVDKCINNAQEHGFAISTIANCYPTGCLGEYVERMTKHELIAVAISSSPPRVSAYNSASRIFSTLGHSFGFPSNNIPYIYDSSVGSITHGQVELARQNTEQLPPNTVMDKSGKFTTEPKDVFNQQGIFDGVIAIAGGMEARKMSGFAGSLELLARLSLANEKMDTLPMGYSSFIAININFITDLAIYKQQVDDLIMTIKSSKRIIENESVSFAGEKSYLQRLRNSKKQNILINSEVYQMINKFL